MLSLNRRTEYNDAMTQATVDDYIATAPKEVQERLQTLRQTIKEIAPDAQERISYGMPFFSYKGRLVYFANAKKYIGLYIPPPIIHDHTEELSHYTTTKSAIHFPLTQDLPVELIKKLVKARMRHNEEQAKNT